MSGFKIIVFCQKPQLIELNKQMDYNKIELGKEEQRLLKEIHKTYMRVHRLDLKSTGYLSKRYLTYSNI